MLDALPSDVLNIIIDYLSKGARDKKLHLSLGATNKFFRKAVQNYFLISAHRDFDFVNELPEEVKLRILYLLDFFKEDNQILCFLVDRIQTVVKILKEENQIDDYLKHYDIPNADDKFRLTVNLMIDFYLAIIMDNDVLLGKLSKIKTKKLQNSDKFIDHKNLFTWGVSYESHIAISKALILPVDYNLELIIYIMKLGKRNLIANLPNQIRKFTANPRMYSIVLKFAERKITLPDEDEVVESPVVSMVKDFLKIELQDKISVASLTCFFENLFKVLTLGEKDELKQELQEWISLNGNSFQVRFQPDFYELVKLFEQQNIIAVDQAPDQNEARKFLNDVLLKRYKNSSIIDPLLKSLLIKYFMLLKKEYANNVEEFVAGINSIKKELNVKERFFDNVVLKFIMIDPELTDEIVEHLLFNLYKTESNRLDAIEESINMYQHDKCNHRVITNFASAKGEQNCKNIYKKMLHWAIVKMDFKAVIFYQKKLADDFQINLANIFVENSYLFNKDWIHWIHTMMKNKFITFENTADFWKIFFENFERTDFTRNYNTAAFIRVIAEFIAGLDKGILTIAAPFAKNSLNTIYKKVSASFPAMSMQEALSAKLALIAMDNALDKLNTLVPLAELGPQNKPSLP